MNFRRFSLVGESNENEIDAGFKNLYPSSSLLEKKCEESLKENFSNGFKVEKPSSTRVIGRAKLNNGKSIQQVMGTLSSNYFLQNYDPVEAHLIEISSWKENDITQKFMSKIEDSDNDKDVIVGHLTAMIDQNYDELMECMKKVQEINVDLFEAGMQIKHSRMKIQSATGFLDKGSINVKNLHLRREKLSGLIDVLRGLKAVKDIYSTMQMKLKTGDVGDAAEYARDIFECFQNDGFGKFSALQSIHSNMPKSIFSIKNKTDKALRRLSCRKFAAVEYDSIIKSYLILNNLFEQFKFDDNYYCEDDGEDENMDNNNCIDSLAQRITSFQLEDIDGCLHSAVMDLIYLAQQHKQQAAAEIAVNGAYQQLKLEEIMDLTEIPLNLLYKRITPELFPRCVMKTCELLADVVHTHYLITQWHLSPFDPRNADETFLHRSSVSFQVDKFDDSGDEIDLEKDSNEDDDDDDNEEEEQVFKKERIFDIATSDEVKFNFGSSNDLFLRSLYGKDVASSSPEKFIRHLEVLMKLQYHNLSHSRKLIWKELIIGIVTMLNNLSFNSTTRFEDFIAMVGSLKLMIKLGKEFCGADSSQLDSCIKEKSEEFFFNFHMESFQVVRMMIEAESWRNIPIECKVNDTILHMLTNFLREFGGVESSNSCNKSDHIPKAIDILQGYIEFGNPFVYQADEKKIDICSRLLNQNSISNSHNLMDIFLREILREDHISDSSPIKKGKNTTKVSSLVVTQVSLNGISKFLIKYLNIMSFLPSAASTIFDHLCQLFDFYLCSVFFGFTPVEEKNRFLSDDTKFTASSPDCSREYEALQNFLERSLGSMVCVNSSNSSAALNSDSSDNISNDNGKKNFETAKIVSSLTVPLVVEEADSPSFFAITERIVAAESCWFLSQVLSESKVIISKLLPEKETNKCDSYISNYVLISGQLRGFLYKAMCPQLHFATQVIGSIVECSWEAKKVREVHHPWVDRLININKQVWNYLQLNDQFGESTTIVREQVWLEICQSAFDITIEGFSKVRKCSSEGRAAMSMDVFALHDGLNSIHLCRPPRGKHYVDNYLRAFYLSEEEIMQWVQDNWQSYPYRHVHGLLSQTMTSMLNSKKLKDALAVIDGLYDSEGAENAKLSSMFSNRFKEDSKFSNLLASKFRR